MFKALYQLLPNVSYGDAITNHVFLIGDILRELGFTTGIFSINIHPKFAGSARNYKDYTSLSSKDNLLIYHFSIGSELTDFIKTLPDRKILVFHNITPPHFFIGINRRVEEDCRRGKEELKGMIPFVDLALGVSEFNRIQLEAMGFKVTGILPIILKEEIYRKRPDRRFMRHFGDGKTNLLHVGRIAPNKRIEDIIKVFYFYHKINPSSRLLIVGTDVDTENYAFALKELADGLGLEGVYFLGMVTMEGLNACYRVASLYICMSEHEGFCVPLLEAMYFGVPIIAYNSTAVPYTLGDSGILINEKNFEEIAEMLDILVRDKGVREKVIEGQRERLKDFSRDRLRDIFQGYISQLKLGFQ